MNMRTGVCARAVSATALLCAALLAIADDRQVVLTPYLWAAGMDGDIQVRGQDVNVNSGFVDLLSNADIGGDVMLELDLGRWVSFVQADYMAIDSGDVDTRTPGVDADMETDATIATLATGYRITTGQRSTLDVLAGVRYTGSETRLSIQSAGNLNTDSDLYDGLIVLRPRLSIAEDWYFSPTLSWGAGDSNQSYELSPQFMYDGRGFQLRIGYRNLSYDFDKGAAQMDFSMRGPIVGIGLSF